ncbi:hypothetical protein [Sediminispirochaeta bajacaliforniensis]|uniref:hypothetical protein n=1 Tax=Sediminispirochaeta bajacaliforniensis TaxID=148 RepID=UPI0003680212|nr:hypothetical protein [Sediminispirochaeta bajacaliforniensis]
MRNRSGMSLRFIRLLFIAALCSILLMGFLYYGGNIVMNELLEKTDFQVKRTEDRVKAFQNYVKKNDVESTDADALLD